MSKRKPATDPVPQFDPALIRELAMCFARAAVDEMLAEQAQKPKTKPVSKRAPA